MTSDIEYLREKGVPTLICDATTALAQERPESPLTWLATWLRSEYVELSNAATYLRDLGIGGIMDHAVIDITKDRPDNVRGYLAKYIERRYSSLGKQQKVAHPQTDESTLGRTQFRVSFAAFQDDDSPSNHSSSPEEDTYSDKYDKTQFKVTSKVDRIGNALEELRSNLMESLWSDPWVAIGEYAKKREGVSSPPDEDLADDQSEEGSSLGSESQYSANFAHGIAQTLTVLHEAIEGYGKGKVSVGLHVTDNCEKNDFNEVVTQFNELRSQIQGDGVDIELRNFPVRRRHDDYRSITTEIHVLMWASISVKKAANPFNQEQNFEIFVNLVGGLSYINQNSTKTKFDYFEVIPSFGQLVNVQQPNKHKDLCNPDAVVRVRQLVEGIHHFKLALVRVAEHIIQSVIQGEFLTDIARRMSAVGVDPEAPLFRTMVARRMSTPSLVRSLRLASHDMTYSHMSSTRRRTAPVRVHEFERFSKLGDKDATSSTSNDAAT
eukprot:TRINITY_DN6709_c0_g1_i1.p1 TRINITY_DN6709_c0_g1~~TRINITY_DN6709_c0_g1_i1.p1  ORF type:complete len:493 (+),score=95.69 TRINITY_DN6709_c0_g1_i1:59-1537(+)